jgi:hypothetical protein
MGRFLFKHNGIMSDVYEPEGGLAEHAAILLYGFPATISENAATDLLVSSGFSVFQPHYPGTYDSEGLFTPQSAVEVIPNLLEALSHGEVRDLKKNSIRAVPRKVVVCIGYSFGCMISLRGIPYLTSLHSLLLLAPAISYGHAPIPSGWNETGPSFLDYLRRSRPFTYRLGETHSWHEFYNGALNYPTGESPESLHTIVGVAGAKDGSFNHAVLQQNFAPVVQRYAGSHPDIKLLTVEDGNHSLNSLITDKTTPIIREACLRATQ